MAPSTEDTGLAANWPGIAAVMGTVLVLAGLLLPAMADSSVSLSENQAQEYYEAHAALERAASQNKRANRGQKSAPQTDGSTPLETARQRFTEAKAGIDASKSGSAKRAFWLKLAGGAFVVVGAGGLVLRKS